jgi:SET domain-containing protein
VDAVKKLLKEDEPDKEKLEKATNELSEELQKVGQAMYGSQGKADSEQANKDSGKDGEEKTKEKSSKKKDDNVEEGEVVE